MSSQGKAESGNHELAQLPVLPPELQPKKSQQTIEAFWKVEAERRHAALGDRLAFIKDRERSFGTSEDHRSFYRFLGAESLKQVLLVARNSPGTGLCHHLVFNELQHTENGWWQALRYTEFTLLDRGRDAFMSQAEVAVPAWEPWDAYSLGAAAFLRLDGTNQFRIVRGVRNESPITIPGDRFPLDMGASLAGFQSKLDEALALLTSTNREEGVHGYFV